MKKVLFSTQKPQIDNSEGYEGGKNLVLYASFKSLIYIYIYIIKAFE